MPGIPTGFRPKAQGCEARVTLGHRSAKPPLPQRGCGHSDSFPRARCESTRGLAHSKTLRDIGSVGWRGSVLDCSGPPPLFLPARTVHGHCIHQGGYMNLVSVSVKKALKRRTKSDSVSLISSPT